MKIVIEAGFWHFSDCAKAAWEAFVLMPVDLHDKIYWKFNGRTYRMADYEGYHDMGNAYWADVSKPHG